MNHRRLLIGLIAVLLLAAARGKSGRRNLAPTLLPGAAGAPAQASSADGYGFGADGFILGTDFYPDRFVVGFKDSAKHASDSPGDVGKWTSLVAISGYPGFSYFDYTNRDLKFAIYYQLWWGRPALGCAVPGAGRLRGRGAGDYPLPPLLRPEPLPLA